MDCILAAMEYSRISTRSMPHSGDEGGISRSGSGASVADHLTGFSKEFVASPKAAGRLLQRRGSGGSISGRSDTSFTKENDHVSVIHDKNQRYPKSMDAIQPEDGRWAKHIKTPRNCSTTDVISNTPEKTYRISGKRRRSSSCMSCDVVVVQHGNP